MAAAAATNAVTPHCSTSKNRRKNVFSPNTSTNITAKGAVDQQECKITIMKNIPTKNDKDILGDLSDDSLDDHSDSSDWKIGDKDSSRKHPCRSLK